MNEVLVEGAPILGGRLLSVQDLPEINGGSLDEWMALAREIRGQFSIIAKSGNVSVAVTDLTGSYQIFVDDRGPSSKFAMTLEGITSHESLRVSRKGLARYAAFGTAGADCTLVEGVSALPGASVSIYDGGKARTAPWFDWRCTALTSASSLDELNREFEAIFASWVAANIPPGNRIGLLLSGGTDSTLLATLMKPLLGDRMVCITQNFFAKRYSERDAAIETARFLKLPILTAQIGRRDYHRAFETLNASSQDAVVHSSQTQNLFCLARFARENGIHTLISGEHADSLFLGFGHFFKDFPAGQNGYQEAISGLSSKEKLDWVVGKADVTPLSLELVKAFGISRREFDGYVAEVIAARRSRFEPLAPLVDMPALQQLAGQIDGGVGWREIGLPVMRALPGCRILCPFFDSEVVKFAIRLPASLKFRDGQTKYFLRQLLKARTGFERPKRPAALSPLRFWRILPNPREYFAVSESIRGLYRQLALKNLSRRGGLYNELARVAALGIWLRSHRLLPDDAALRQPRRSITPKSSS